VRTNVYVDGFNLFYGALRGTQFRWLDLEAFFDGLLPRNQVQAIHYFTARVKPRPDDPDAHLRQQVYLRALGTLPRVQVHFGVLPRQAGADARGHADGRWSTNGRGGQERGEGFGRQPRGAAGR